MRKMKYLKLFESHSKLFESSELMDQFDDDYIEEYWAKNLAYTDIDDIISIFPQYVWRFVDDNEALDSIKSDEINNLTVDDFWEDDFKKYINGKYIESDDREEIYQKYIDSEIDPDEIADLKVDIKEEEDEIEKKKLKKKLRKLKKRIKEIKEMDLDDLLDEMDEDTLKEVITNILDESDFIENAVEKRFDNYGSLEDYIEEIWGSTDSIEFGTSYRNGSRTSGDWDWILNFVDHDKLIEAYTDEEDFDHKKGTIEGCISDTGALQRKLLEIDSKNALELFDEINTSSDSIGDEYDFQKAYIEAYAENYAYGEESDIPEGKGKALKNLYDKFGLDREIEDEYVDFMHYVHAEKYNL